MYVWFLAHYFSIHAMDLNLFALVFLSVAQTGHVSWWFGVSSSSSALPSPCNIVKVDDEMKSAGHRSADSVGPHSFSFSSTMTWWLSNIQSKSRLIVAQNSPLGCTSCKLVWKRWYRRRTTCHVTSWLGPECNSGTRPANTQKTQFCLISSLRFAFLNLCKNDKNTNDDKMQKWIWWRGTYKSTASHKNRFFLRK